MKLKIYQVDAFTDKQFAGNPAAVCPLESWLPDEVMQAVAEENNLSETAFFMPENGGFRLRWFTPRMEVDLCGHATLASAYVLFEHELHQNDRVVFETRSGKLTVKRRDSLLEMDFPALGSNPIEDKEKVSRALGKNAESVYASRFDWMAVYSNEQQVRDIDPDMQRLSEFDARGVIVTAQGESCDFVSRFFAPRAGISEDPVTGSAHSVLVPFWAEHLQRDSLHARQLSRRGGELFCEFRGDRVSIAGQCVLYMIGTLYL